MKKPTRLFLSLTLGLSTLTISSCANLINEVKSNKTTKIIQKSGFDYEHFVLDNGLNVYLSKNDKSPRFQAEIAVNAGSKNDPEDATGIAHYLEHMLFKGTTDLGTKSAKAEKEILDKITKLYDERFYEKDDKKRKSLQSEINKLSVEASKLAIPGELDALYSSLGAKGLNAYTSDEETVYIVNLPKNRLEQWAKVESNRFKNPVFRLFQSELETVYEEKNRSLDNKERVLWNAVSQELYKNHQYGTQTTLGTVDHLKNPSLKKMYEFYRNYYVPNNMAIVISGDIDITETKKTIKKYFNSWEKKSTPKFIVKKENPINGRKEVNVKYKGAEKIDLAFRTQNYYQKDRHALVLIDMILDSGEAGLIKLNLVNPQKLRSAGSYPYIREDYGEQHLYAILKEGQSKEEAEKLLLEQIEIIKSGEFDESVLKGIILSFEIGEKGSIESNRGRVNTMKESFLKGVKVEDISENFIKKLKSISKDEIVEVANKYFNNDYIIGYRKDEEQTFPKIQKPKLEKVKLNPNEMSLFRKNVLAMKTNPIEPTWVDYEKDFKVKSYAPGVLFYHTTNKANDLFNFSIDYDFGGKHYPNFCYVMDELNFAGTDEMNPKQVKNEFFKMGISSNFSCGDYGFSLNVSGVDSEFEEGLKLTEKILWDAKLSQKHLDDVIKNTINNRKDQKKDLKTLQRAFSRYIRYDKDSAYIDRLRSSDLKDLSIYDYPNMKKSLKKQNFKIYYSGKLPMEKVESLVKKYHQPNEIKVPLLNPRKAPESELVKRHEKPVKIYFLNYKGVQSHILLSIPGKSVNPEEEVINSLFNQYFDGGMGAILFQEVRESRALAYSTWNYKYQGARLGDQNQTVGYIGTQADKTIESLKLYIDLLKNMPKSKQHFERAKKSLENSFRTAKIGFRGVVRATERWADLGYSKDPRPENFEKLKDLSYDDLMEYISDKIANEKLTFMIVGDKNKLDMASLKKIGDFEEIPLKNLFTD